MRNLCEARVKNRVLLAKIPCGRSGRICSVSGESFSCPPMVLCATHRKREAKRYKISVIEPTLEEKFWAQVNKNGPIPEYCPALGPCWIWTGTLTPLGYPTKWKFNGRQEPMYEISCQLEGSPHPPKGFQRDHLCRVHACVNPSHIETVTSKVNTLRGFATSAINARKTHCSRGHEFTEENTYVNNGKNRRCATCHKDWERRKYLEVVRKPVINGDFLEGL